MNPREFAEKYFGEFEVKGQEIIPTYCPVCSGGQHNDKYTFALNESTLLYNCKRGSCGTSGTFKQLLREYGEMVEKNYELHRSAPRVFKSPVSTIKPAGKKVADYLELRRISRKIWEHYGVGEVNGNIAFPYYEDGNLVLMKFRAPQKHDGKGPKAWREEGGKAVFWGMDKCDFSRPLTICEGEMDMLALAECGVVNVTSVPSGAEDLSCVDNCWDWLQQFKQVIIWPDNDKPGQEMCRKLIQRLGAWRCSVVYSKYKDANEALYKGGVEETLTDYYNAKAVPMAGLIKLSEVQGMNLEDMKRIKSSVAAINKYTQGYMGGQVTILTGVNGSGKSTFAGQELLEAINQGVPVCAYSGELPAPLFKYWVELQAAGSQYLASKVDVFSGQTSYYVKPEIKDKIRAWYSDYFYLFDTFGDASEDNIIEVFSYAAQRYGCEMFLIDNLMTVESASQEKEHYRRQADFIKQVKSFARKYDVHVILVAHPRKVEGKPTKVDVAGAGELTNTADNVINVYRPKEDEDNTYDGLIDVFKCRWSGTQNATIGMQFDNRSKRYYAAKEQDRRDYEYGWVK